MDLSSLVVAGVPEEDAELLAAAVDDEDWLVNRKTWVEIEVLEGEEAEAENESVTVLVSSCVTVGAADTIVIGSI